MNPANYNRDIENNLVSVLRATPNTPNTLEPNGSSVLFNKIARHEKEINELKKAVFGTPCSRFIDFIEKLYIAVLFIIIYLKAFEHIDKNGNWIKQ